MIFWWWLLKEEIMFTWTVIETLLSLKKEKLCKTIKKGCQIKPFSKNECILGIDRWDKFYGTLLYMNECINCIATLVPKPFMAKNADAWYETTVNFIFCEKLYLLFHLYSWHFAYCFPTTNSSYCNDERVHILDYTT